MFAHESNLEVHLQKVEYGSSLKNNLNSFNVASSHCRPCSIPSISMTFITFGTPLAPNAPDHVTSQSLVHGLATYRQHSHTLQTTGAQVHYQRSIHYLVVLNLQRSTLLALLVPCRGSTSEFHPGIDSPTMCLQIICQFSSKPISSWEIHTSINIRSENFPE